MNSRLFLMKKLHDSNCAVIGGGNMIIAEIGCNHKGDMDIAKKMIETAAVFCNVDAVKFQKRTPRELLSEVEYNAPHPVAYNSYGKTYGEHREYLEFNLDQHQELKQYCEQAGLIYSCSVWDLTAAKEIASLCPDIIKIPSARNTDYGMLRWLAGNYDGEIHVSLGMTTHKEEEEVLNLFTQFDRLGDLVLYACTSDYPVEFEDICLYEIVRLINSYGDHVKQIGFSGHHKGIAVDIAALTLGASYIERHYTLNRTWKGTDHAASLEPGGLRKLVRDVECVKQAFGYKKTEILETEKGQRGKLKCLH